ncbi:MAG: AAA family ATPase [Myxococcota bacterium]
MQSLRVEGLGPLKSAHVRLADLTVLVGPQASGKSVLLQTLKAAVDMDPIVDALKRHGYHWKDDPRAFYELLYGEGMGSLASPTSRIEVDGTPWDPLAAADESWSKKSRAAARMFYVPAQRVLTLQDGWPTPFGGYPIGAPYVVKQFSEDLRLQLEERERSSEALFPVPTRWKAELRKAVADAVFHDAEVMVDSTRLRKRVVLKVSGSAELPFLSWSAGQREFIPLMLGLYWLMPTQGSAMRRPLEWAVIEEPEMGLHPAAVNAVGLLILDLLKRGYRVVLSTHSPHLIELVWALDRIRDALRFDSGHLARLFDVPATPGVREIAEAMVEKTFSVTYLSGGQSKDISSLDPADEDTDVAGWGGLTNLAERANDLVAETRLL